LRRKGDWALSSSLAARLYTGVLSEKADSIVATDISPGMLAVATKQVKAENVKFQLEDCQKTSFPDAAFDTAFMAVKARLVVSDERST
jgi:ubiquinone/menaquinone biosynthesis C-methylase UbiE